MIRKFFLPLFLLTLFALPVFSQKPKPKPTGAKKPASIAAKTRAAKEAAAKKEATTKEEAAAKEKEELDKALAETDLTQKIAALQKFNENYPNSAERNRVLEIVVSSRAQLADEKLRAGATAEGIELFKQAVKDAPSPISEKLFAEVISQFPTNLFYQNQQAAAVEVAQLIEEKVSADPKQLLDLAPFYLGTENAEGARELASKAIAIDPNLPAAYQTLGMVNRLDFQLEDSATAYAKALELDPNSLVSKRSLGEMKRATGKTDEAITIYRELLEKSPDDAAVQTGLTLSLFDAEKTEEAEAELAKSLEKNPNNLFLLVGAAYWYAAHRDGAKAVDYARRAVALEPRYTWAHIALARGFMVQGTPLEAERELLAARQYGNFPTLDYEIASARLAAGLYEEAGRELRKSFAIKDDLIETRLGNRIPKQSKSFIELVESERRASIFQPVAADDPTSAEKLKSLLRLNQTLDSTDAKEEEITQAVTDFVSGDDKAKIHRQLYAANRLLQAKKELPKVLELTQAAISGVDSALDVPNAAAAVMADELFESRTIAMSRNEVIVVPKVPNQTLSAILRGRIEELAGWTLYQQDKPQEAVVRLKRAVSILPEKSAWWKSSTWKLAAALDAAGKQSEALDMYIKNYMGSDPDSVKYSVIEALYQKVNGNTDGLEKRVGAKPVSTIAVSSTPAEASNPNTEVAKVEASPSPTPTEVTTEASAKPEAAATPKAALSPEPTPEQKADVSPTPETTPQTENKTENKSAVKTEETSPAKTEASPTPNPDTVAEVKPSPAPTPEIKQEETPAPSPATETKSENKGAEVIEKLVSAPEAKSTPKPLFDPIVITVPKPEIPKKQTSATTTGTGEKLADTDGALKPDETKKEEIKEEPKADSKSENKTSDIPDVLKSKTPIDGSGEVRPRLFPPNPPVQNAKSESGSCQLMISQDSLTILSQGGNLGVLLGFQGDGGDAAKLTAAVSSPNDIQVERDPEIGKQSNRAFFLIKSISSNKGAYTVTFDSPCGKKEVLVKVR